MGAWSNVDALCQPVPTGGSGPVSAPTCDNVTYAVGWDQGTAGTGRCQAPGNMVGATAGSTFTLVNTAPGFAGQASFVCPSGGGGWQMTSATCGVSAAPPTPAPASCPAQSGSHTWGSAGQCSATVNAPVTLVGGSYSVRDANNRGEYFWNCTAGGTWVAATGSSCPELPLTPPVTLGCASQRAPLALSVESNASWEYQNQLAQWPILPATANGASVPFVSTYHLGNYAAMPMSANAGFMCSAGTWSVFGISYAFGGNN
jgi:hypothetical protein